MRIALFGVALLALAALASPDSLRGALAASAGSLLEATPFVLAATIATRLVRSDATAFLGCGCGTGPGARSLPAAVATCMLFGPLVAAARFAAALLVAHVLARYRRHTDCTREPADLLGELAALLPAALLAGAAMQYGALVDPARLPPLLCALGGALLGFAAAPCALGAVAVAGALAARSPLAAAAFLCVAGIVDLRALSLRPHAAARHDAFSYAALAAALAIVALRRGDSLVHPALTPLIGVSAAAALGGAFAYRRRLEPARRAAPLVMLAGALLAAPPPPYHATETTLAGLFADERLTFTGVLVHDAGASALVRYAITCCRADAAPIVVGLERSPPYRAGSWLRVDGRIGGDLRLVAEHMSEVAPPSDPFVYR